MPLFLLRCHFLVVILKLTQSKIGKQCERNVAIGRIPYTFD